ncbi:hypothetical protein RB195_010179 [Necator americanus]|uniref:Reverse transcriptase domain-containing protein n=1 Tax=Necator americanus TaxID=51031 RepID=A0ABR1CY12_NECAM
MSVRNRTAPGPDRIRPEHLKNLSPVPINTLESVDGYCRPICLLSVIYKLFTRVILSKFEKVLDEEQSCEQAGFRKDSVRLTTSTVSKLIAVSRGYKMPLCLTFIYLKKAFD